MSEQQVKLENWPFKNGEQAQLLWISSPFSLNHKIMLNAYFRANEVTKKVLVDWGTLPALAIQHFYVNGDIRKSVPPMDTEQIEITIHPNLVMYSEKKWNIHGTKENDVSRSFIVTNQGKKYILPLIEVVRSILAPNRFLLYRLFESNSFPQFFIEQYELNKIHLAFSSNYDLKYTRQEFLYQLVWLLSRPDLRNIFENIAFNFMSIGILKFDWTFTQPIIIRALVKQGKYGSTILKVECVKNKILPFNEISFSHPGLQEHEKSNEAKKYTFYMNSKVQGTDDITLNVEVDGTTDSFDLVEMGNQKHEYTSHPKVTKIQKKSAKQRIHEDENTKKYYFEDKGDRSTGDVGGQQLVRGLEYNALHEIQLQGELQDFINVLKILEQHSQISSIRVIMDILPEGNGERKFKYLDDGTTRRKYVIAEVYMAGGKKFNIIEVERENRSLSLLILSSNMFKNWNAIYTKLLLTLVNGSGFWHGGYLENIKNNNVDVKRMKHSRKNITYRAESLLNKLLKNIAT
ncbi:Tn7-like element transposition protein TnsE [Rummeliibacillus suwonensis]|uniref:Tn7-like element transposition protein TnsE n=1 Tax=Rummeliibacillus suwonensis TaxID=1306154 RepID=UPI0011B400F1|nr:Tn7-like element transposition protein TnsE [Rummeliibacillus suwonensis]